MTRPTTPTAQYLYDAIEASDKTQREIAREVGFTNANVLSMMKSGETKTPINRISALAKALQVSPAIFLQTALREYHPELYEVITEHYGMGLSLGQQVLLEVYDEACTIAPVEMEEGLCEVLLASMIYAGRMQAGLHETAVPRASDPIK